MKQITVSENTPSAESIDSVRAKANRKRAHTVPGTMIAPIRAGIVLEMKGGRSCAQVAKDNNASQSVVLELWCRAKFFALDQKVKQLEEIVYRRAA